MAFHDIVTANKEHFDHVVPTEEQKAVAAELNEKLCNAMIQTGVFSSTTAEMLDFACGTGAVAKYLSPRVKSVLGIDVSPRSIEQLKASLTPEEAQKVEAKALDLEKDNDELNGRTFDVITCSMAYHHFPSAVNMTKILSTLLKPNGTLLVTDATTQADLDLEGNFSKIVSHAVGYSEEDMRKIFEDAGLKLTKYEYVTSYAWPGVGLDGREIDVFLAMAEKD